MIHYGMTKTAQLAIARGRGRDDRRDRHHGQRGAARPDGVGGRGDVRGQTGRGAGRGPPAVEARVLPTARPSSLLQRFATAEEVARWSSTCAARSPRPRTGRPSGWTAAWSGRSSDLSDGCRGRTCSALLRAGASAPVAGCRRSSRRRRGRCCRPRTSCRSGPRSARRR